MCVLSRHCRSICVPGLIVRATPAASGFPRRKASTITPTGRRSNASTLSCLEETFHFGGDLLAGFHFNFFFAAGATDRLRVFTCFDKADRAAFATARLLGFETSSDFFERPATGL